jgi:hypothetical protein
MSLGIRPCLIPRWPSYCLDCDILARSQWKLHDSYVQRGNPLGKEQIVCSDESLRCPRCALSPKLYPDSPGLADHHGPVHCPVVQTLSSSKHKPDRYLSMDDLCNYAFNAGSLTGMTRQLNDDSVIGSDVAVVPGYGALGIKSDGQMDGDACRSTEYRVRSKSI